MAERWGELIFWTATIVTGLIAVLVVVGYVSNAGEGEPIIPIVPLMLAGAIFLVGWVCRHV